MAFPVAPVSKTFPNPGVRLTTRASKSMTIIGTLCSIKTWATSEPTLPKRVCGDKGEPAVGWLPSFFMDRGRYALGAAKKSAARVKSAGGGKTGQVPMVARAVIKLFHSVQETPSAV